MLMKITKLLVLGALLLTGSEAFAIDNVWSKPAFPASSIPEVTQFTTYQEEAEVYLYNVKTHLFYTNGNNWATRASLLFATGGNADGATAGQAVKGIMVKFTRTEAAVEQGEGVVELKDDVKAAGTFISAFADAWDGIWTDNNSNANRFWKVTPSGDSYRISNVTTEPSKYLGFGGNDTRLYLLDANAEGAGVDWKLVTPDVYKSWEAVITDDQLAAVNGWLAQFDTYNAAQQLKAIIEDAQKVNAQVADQLVVYNNTASTLEEINAAIEAVKNAIVEREKEQAEEGINKATVENPVDVTALFIKNPTFIGNKYDGWDGKAFGGYNPQENAEHYNTTYDTWQLLEGLPAGVYKFNANAFYRAGDAGPAYTNFKAQNAASQYAKLFAVSDGDSLTRSVASPYTPLLTAQMSTGTWSSATDPETQEVYWIPNNMVAADEFFKAGYCNDNAVFMGVGESGIMRVGVRKDVTTGGDWSIFDDFSLTYYGNSAEAYQMWLDEAMKDVKEIVVEEGTLYTAAILEEYNKACAAEKKAGSKAEVNAILGPIAEASEALAENIALWKELLTVIEDAKNTGANPDLNPFYTEPLADWAELEVEDVLLALALTNDELSALITEKKAEIVEAQKHPRGSEVDMTRLLVNPNYSDGKTGWTQEAVSGGNVTTGGTSTNTCYEAWNNGGFDIYQMVQGAPKGVYEISVQGFYRYGRSAYNDYLNQSVEFVKPGKAPVYVYLNDNQTPFTNVYGDPKQITDATFYDGSTDYVSETGLDGTAYFYPNGMASAAIAFSDGMYTQSAYGLVTEDDGQLRIGVKGVSNQLGDSWCIWDNFKLVWKGFNAEVIQPVLETNIEKAKEDLNAPIGKDVAQALQAALDAATAAIATGDGENMFDALSALFATNKDVIASKSLFEQLAADAEELATRRNMAVSSAATIMEADALVNKINTGIEEHSIADTEVEGLEKEITILMSKLGVPEDITNATDAAPINVTSAIINPDCATNKGWNGTPAFNTSAKDAEKFNTNFDVNQVIYGLPAGTYTVTLTGFYRSGTAQNDYDTFIVDPAAGNNAFLYASGNEGDTCSVAIKRLSSDMKAFDEETVPEGWLKPNGAQAIVPNSMATAGEYFLEGKYQGNEVTVKLAEGQNLTIGVKKNTTITDDWTIWTDWQLTYYGANSSKEVNGDASLVDAVDAETVVNTEFFSLSGVQKKNPAPGVAIMKQTLSNGTIKVSKITIK